MPVSWGEGEVELPQPPVYAERDRYREELLWLFRNLSIPKDGWDQGDIMTQREARHRIEAVLNLKR